MLCDICFAPTLDCVSCVWRHMNYHKIDQLQSNAHNVIIWRLFAATIGIEGYMRWLLRKKQRHLKLLRFWNSLMQMSYNTLTCFVWGYCNGNKKWYSNILQIFQNLEVKFIYENLMKCDNY